MRRLSVSISDQGLITRSIEEVNLSDIDTNEVLIKVAFSSLNYKDALSASGNKGISRFYPHTPGIDAAGEVIRSSSSLFKPGDKVIATGFDLGMNTKGGYSEYISVPAHWLVHLPEELSLKEAMIFGTAGLTAAMCIDKIFGFDLKTAPVIVSGATGGVGSLTLAILNKLDIETVALSRKTEAAEYFLKLGTKNTIHTLESSNKSLLKATFSGAIDTVGGNVLAGILKQITPNGAVAICGMAASPELNTTVFPFILRGISMFGVDSAEANLAWRQKLWNLLANDWKPENLESISKTVSLHELDSEIQKMLDGNATGRVVIDLSL